MNDQCVQMKTRSQTHVWFNTLFLRYFNESFFVYSFHKIKNRLLFTPVNLKNFMAAF